MLSRAEDMFTIGGQAREALEQLRADMEGPAQDEVH
jgi:hypothetical protein